ncbi:hypothetical protein [Streptomyces sp. SD31]|uniref:hypothetical protein n=1 Tax=Streptomyces sp. SD31 TaxID=3452208 RepID=UPI003F8B011B
MADIESAEKAPRRHSPAPESVTAPEDAARWRGWSGWTSPVHWPCSECSPCTLREVLTPARSIPTSAERAMVQRIPNNGGGAVTGPVTVSDQTLTVSGNSASVSVPRTDVADGYTVTLVPPSNNTASTVAVAQHSGQYLDDTNLSAADGTQYQQPTVPPSSSGPAAAARTRCSPSSPSPRSATARTTNWPPCTAASAWDAFPLFPDSRRPVLKAASAVFAAECVRPVIKSLVAFFGEFHKVFGVERLCRVLSNSAE